MSSHASGDGGGACWACLLHHLSCCLSSAALSFAPSSPLHQHISALPLLLDRLLSFTPHLQRQNEAQDRLSPASSLLQMDILRLLLVISENLRVLLSTVAGSYADDTHECMREEVGLLDGSVRDSRWKGCLDFLLPFLCKSVQKECRMKEVQTRESSDVGKRLMKGVSDLAEYSQVLRLSLENLRLKLSSTAELITSMLVVPSSHQQHVTSCATSARLRTCIRSFLYEGHAESPSNSEHPDPASFYGEEWLVKKAEVVIEKLLNPQGPSIVGIGGRSGAGKSCLASQIASDTRIAANFPGGVVSLSVGHEPDLTSLQAFLWKCMWGDSICYSTSFKTFSSLEEGTSALMTRVQEWLPCLVVLDDVWNVDHVRPFMCFEGTDNGRILVVSQIVENVLVELEGDMFVHVLNPLDEEESTNLFNSIAAFGGSERASTLAACTSKCGGLPRFLEAAASILYYEKARAFISPSVISFLKQGVIVDLEARPPTKRMSASEVAGDWEEQPEQQEYTNTSPLEANIWNICVFFDALAEVHPGLQECFLDLAAFPKGKWLSSSMLVDVWSFGDGMEKERVFFVLGFLASRSLIEWKVEERSDGELEEDFSFQCRLAGEFYDLAQALSKRRLEETPDSCAWNNRKKRNYSCGDEQVMDGQIQDVNGILSLLLSAVDAFDIFTWQVNQKADSIDNSVSCYMQEHSTLRLNDIRAKMKVASRRGPGSCPPRMLQGDYRLFIPGSEQGSSNWWNEQTLLNKATKLSLISGSLEEFPSEAKLTNLKVALLSGNRKLQSIPASTLKCMEKLVVLDLKQCISLTLLPDSICTLQNLELLELSSCTHLLSLPQSIGKLGNLKFLRLSGCLSLTCLPMSLGRLSNLAILDLSLCVRLKCLPKTLGHLSCLQTLNLSGCFSLQCLPATMVLLRKLTIFVLSGCCNLSYTDPWFEQIKILAGWRSGGVTAIPLNFWKLGQIEVLHLCSLKNLTYLPQSVGKLQHLKRLNLSSCRSLDHLPDDLGSLFLLEKLDLSHTAVRKLPTTVGQLSSLVTLCLRGCSRLLCIPSSVSALPKLECLEMAECWDFVMLPVEFGSIDSLRKLILLDLSGCSIKQLPHFAKGALPMLRELNLSGCQNLLYLPETLGKLTSLEKINIEGCKSLSSLQGISLATLNQLQWLNLRNCLSLTSLPVLEMQALQSLKFLDVSGCTKLSPFPEPLLLSAKEHRFTLVRWGTVWH